LKPFLFESDLFFLSTNIQTLWKYRWFDSWWGAEEYLEEVLQRSVQRSESRKLIINEKTIDLTVTETRILLIFALSPNETIERSRLQKEIWEVEGVIVGRSLDMFISKLRKKLEPDSTIKIAVIRGKGYKLEINS
jgi:DNA-binding response OmpR family regulator